MHLGAFIDQLKTPELDLSVKKIQSTEKKYQRKKPVIRTQRVLLITDKKLGQNTLMIMCSNKQQTSI